MPINASIAGRSLHTLGLRAVYCLGVVYLTCSAFAGFKRFAVNSWVQTTPAVCWTWDAETQSATFVIAAPATRRKPVPHCDSFEKMDLATGRAISCNKSTESNCLACPLHATNKQTATTKLFESRQVVDSLEFVSLGPWNCCSRCDDSAQKAQAPRGGGLWHVYNVSLPCSSHVWEIRAAGHMAPDIILAPSTTSQPDLTSTLQDVRSSSTALADLPPFDWIGCTAGPAAAPPVMTWRSACAQARHDQPEAAAALASPIPPSTNSSQDPPSTGPSQIPHGRAGIRAEEARSEQAHAGERRLQSSGGTYNVGMRVRWDLNAATAQEKALNPVWAFPSKHPLGEGSKHEYSSSNGGSCPTVPQSDGLASSASVAWDHSTSHCSSDVTGPIAFYAYKDSKCNFGYEKATTVLLTFLLDTSGNVFIMQLNGDPST
ncbi:hypothetical protein CYMTET_34629, partial [Cymbomonas tetramitiformis]